METSMSRLFRIVLLIAAGYASAAAQTGSVVGQVVDPQGAPIEHANVVLAAQRGSGVQFTATYVRTGEFEFPAVAPGAYTLTIKAPGWSDRTVPNIRISSCRVRDAGKLTLHIACLSCGMLYSCCKSASSTGNNRGSVFVRSGCRRGRHELPNTGFEFGFECAPE